jgi:membrane protease YdiL (CAAX protease family)
MWRTYGGRPGLGVNYELRYLAAHAVGLVLIPLAVALIGFRAYPRELGLGLGRPRVWWPYIALAAALVAPAIWFASRRPGFHNFYPYWPGARESPGNFLLHEAVMAVVIFANEFFFRGYMFTLARRDMPAAAAIVFQMVPYALAHAAKPLEEFASSVLAGLALGLVAWRGRSIWPGAILHIVCATTIDIASVPDIAREVPHWVLRVLTGG